MHNTTRRHNPEEDLDLYMLKSIPSFPVLATILHAEKKMFTLCFEIRIFDNVYKLRQ